MGRSLLMTIFLALLFSFQQVDCKVDSNKSLQEEDDAILAASFQSSNDEHKKRQFIQQPQQQKLVEQLPVRRNYKQDAENIVGDVGRYGLWEYTSDNTGMGDQIKQLMSKDNSYEIGGEAPGHALESEALKKNEQINKFAEATYSQQSNIDPMEQPPELDHMGAPNQAKEFEYGGAPNEQQGISENHDEDVKVVSIPSSLTIEDEHGQHLDTASITTPDQPELVKSENKIQQAVKSGEIAKDHHLKTTDFLVEKLSKATDESLSKTDEDATMVNKDSDKRGSSDKQPFTIRLLKAMKENEGFRKRAESFLPQQTDTGLQLYQKDRQLFNLLKEFENSPKEDLSLAASKLHIPQYKKKDGKLLSSIRLLIHDDYSSHDEEQKVVNDLLNTMTSAEKEEGKVESDFTDGGAGGGGGETLSDGYLNHFKEFVENHKKQAALNHLKKDHEHNHAETDAEDAASRKTDGQALLKFLEKEASSHNKFRESNTKNPKQDLERMEAMIAKQEGKEEPLDGKNDKLLNEQLEQLMDDKSHSEKELGKLKAHNGDSKDKVAVANKSDQLSSIPSSEIEVFDNSILKYIQTSKRFQNFLKDKGVLPATSSRNATTEGNTRGMGSEVEMFERPLADQFEEIELQKEILNLRERQLRNRDRNKYLKRMEQESINKALTQAKTNHLLHLTNPEREKASVASQKDETTTELQDFQKFAADYKLLKIRQHQKLKKKDLNSSSTSKKTTTTNKVAEVPVATKDEVHKLVVDDGSGEGSGGSSETNHDAKITKISSPSPDEKEKTTINTEASETPTTSENPIVVTATTESAEKPEKPATEETESPISIHTASSLQPEDISDSDSGFSKRTEKPEVVIDDDTMAIKKRNRSITSPQDVTAVHEEKLTLPINNPKPEATLTLTPNADFISSSSSAAVSSHELARIIRPSHHHHIIENLTSIIQHDDLTSGERRHNLPTNNQQNAKTRALIGKLHTSPAHRRQFAILEPPTIDAMKANKKNLEAPEDQAFIKPNTIVQPSHADDVGPKNLLKHRIPSPGNEDVKKSLQMFVHSVARKGVPRFIRPSSIHTSDVRASKKGFGKLPQKPKEYLLRELQRDIRLLDKKSKLLNNNQQQQMNNITATTTAASRKDNVVETAPLKHNVTSLEHVLVPAGVTSPMKPTKRSQIHIEDVFNILKAEDQP